VAFFHNYDIRMSIGRAAESFSNCCRSLGTSRFGQTRSAAEYGDKSGVIQVAAGILRISVGVDWAGSKFVRFVPDFAENGARSSGSVLPRWKLAPRGAL